MFRVFAGILICCQWSIIKQVYTLPTQLAIASWILLKVKYKLKYTNNGDVVCTRIKQGLPRLSRRRKTMTIVLMKDCTKRKQKRRCRRLYDTANSVDRTQDLQISRLRITSVWRSPNWAKSADEILILTKLTVSKRRCFKKFAIAATYRATIMNTGVWV